uniref:Secreted protein n=1 Tax=Romanomermis culicivorax TaxID=13658 RepID=A0A915HSZ3_ROMCU
MVYIKMKIPEFVPAAIVFQILVVISGHNGHGNDAGRKIQQFLFICYNVYMLRVAKAATSTTNCCKKRAPFPFAQLAQLARLTLTPQRGPTVLPEPYAVMDLIFDIRVQKFLHPSAIVRRDQQVKTHSNFRGQSGVVGPTIIKVRPQRPATFDQSVHVPGHQTAAPFDGQRAGHQTESTLLAHAAPGRF